MQDAGDTKDSDNGVCPQWTNHLIGRQVSLEQEHAGLGREEDMQSWLWCQKAWMTRRFYLEPWAAIEGWESSRMKRIPYFPENESHPPCWLQWETQDSSEISKEMWAFEMEKFCLFSQEPQVALYQLVLLWEGASVIIHSEQLLVERLQSGARVSLKMRTLGSLTSRRGRPLSTQLKLCKVISAMVRVTILFIEQISEGERGYHS